MLKALSKLLLCRRFHGHVVHILGWGLSVVDRLLRQLALVGNRVEVRSVSRATGFAPRWTVVASGRNLSLKNALALVLYYDLSFAGGLSTFPVHSDGSVALLGR